MAFRLIPQDILIKEVGKEYTLLSREKKFYLDNTSGEVFEKRPFGFSITRDWKYFVVDLERIYSYKGLLKKVEELDDSIFIQLTVNYKLKLLPEINTRFLQDLIASEKSHLSLMNTLISDWIDEYTNNHSGFMKNFVSTKHGLEDFLAAKAFSKGIALEVVVGLKKDSGDFHNIQGEVPIRVLDYAGKVNLGFNIDLEVSEINQVKGVFTLSASQNLKRKIGKYIRNILKKHVDLNLHTLCFETNTTVRKIVESKLSELLSADGLSPLFLDLTVEVGDMPPQREQYEYTIEGVNNNSYKIKVNHILRLTLIDLGKYFSSGVKNLDSWLESELKRFTQDYIFEKEFTELVVNFDEKEIKENMKKEVEKIGFEVKQLTTVPDLQKILPKYIEFEIGDQHQFPTKRELNVKINVFVSGKVMNISRLQGLLSPKTTAETLQKKMKEAVLGVAKRFIRALEPEDFYMRFEITSDGAESESEKLESLIKEKLREDFGVETTEVTCKVLETDLIKVYNALLGDTYLINVESRSGEIVYDIPFDVVGVSEEGWHVFKAKSNALKKEPKSILQQIAKRMKYYIEMRLSDYWEYKLLNNNEEAMTEILTHLSNGLKRMRKEFGLKIVCSEAWNSKRSPRELAIRKESQMKREKESEIKEMIYNKKVKDAEKLIDLDITPTIQKYQDHPEKIEEDLKALEREHLMKPNSKKIEEENNRTNNKKKEE
jgi:hypothetical protein